MPCPRRSFPWGFCLPCTGAPHSPCFSKHLKQFRTAQPARGTACQSLCWGAGEGRRLGNGLLSCPFRSRDVDLFFRGTSKTQWLAQAVSLPFSRLGQTCGLCKYHLQQRAQRFLHSWQLPRTPGSVPSPQPAPHPQATTVLISVTTHELPLLWKST